MAYNILSCDGGGIRSILTASICRELQKDDINLMRQIDAFAGTSGGAIVSAGLAIGMTPDEVVDSFKASAKNIFKTTINRKLGNLFGVFGATYDNSGLINEVKKIFGNMRFKDLKRSLLVTSFDLQYKVSMTKYKWRPTVFHNLGKGATPDEFVADAVIRSASAPTYFPSYQGYIDGGVFANNPAMAILSQAMKNDHASVINLLSIGTGDIYRNIPGDNNDWGVGQWVTDVRIIDLLMSAPNEATDYYCKAILGDRYLRINPPIQDIPLDAVGRMGELESLASGCIDTSTICWIDKYIGIKD